MTKTIARATPMSKVIAIRATEADVAEVKLAALSMGMDVSAFFRYLLIKEKIITPSGVRKETKW